MTKYFITSDIHGFFDIFYKTLFDNGFEINNPNHKIIICGDLLDRGDQTVETFEFVKKMGNRVIYILGNHEQLLNDCVKEIRSGRIPGHHHFSNGTVKTICQFCGENEWIIYDPTWRDKICEIMQPILDFIDENCVDYYEVGDYIFTHGWIPSFSHLDDFRDGDENDWKQARWSNGMDMWRNPANRVEGKTIVCGHWHCSWGWSHIDQKYKEFPQPSHKHFEHSFKPWAKDGIIAIDACTAYSGKINVLVVENG